ncbi:MAG: type IV pilus secretin PilQ [Thiocapsa sp.]|uniref:type IV pilus secretin PilQ n=1 Tax=Thiocapsa sp. TaxID=2024551 RepID=UPI001BD03DE1|nr:type IV pilus secretin PilQ [Thiocapsa sp.]QVL47335.1 MAG: type IV pilus secretin PilQ [Thiocapsa sp.]
MNSPYRPSPHGSRGILRRVLRYAALLGLFIGAANVAAVDLTDVQFAAQPGNRVEIQLLFSGSVSAPQTFDTLSPARIALDFEGVANRLERRAVPIGVGPVHSLVAVAASDRTRIVINLNDSVPYRVTTEGNRVRVDIDARNEPDAARPASPAPAAARTQARAPASAPWDRPTSDGGAAPGPSVRDIDFRRGPEGEGRVLIKLPNATTRVTVREQGSRVFVDIIDAALPQRLFRRLDVVDFATPVVAIESRPKGRNVEVNVQTGSDFEYMAYQTDDLFTLELRPLTSAEKERLAREKVVYDGERLSLNFQDIEVRAVLQLLADFTDLNLVASDSVAGNITLRLKNVPWDQALDIILKTKNLTKRQDGNVIMVGPFDEIVGHEERTLTADQRLEELAPIRSEFIPVKFAKAAEIASFIRGASSLQSSVTAQGRSTPIGRDSRTLDRTVSESTKDSILTPGRGSVTFDERTNTLLVMDTSARLDQIREIVARLDIPVRQVMIESRVVIANNDFARDLGVRFGLATSMGALYNNEMLIGGGLPGNLVGRGNYDAGPFGLNTAGQPNNAIILNPVGENPAPSLLVNLPATNPAGAVNFLIGKVGSYLLQLELSAMQREGRGEVISSPRVITSDQKQARIEVGKEIPYAIVVEQGATPETDFKKAVLSLTVTPAITPDDRIIMDLIVTKDEPDFSEVVLGQPTINTREIETRVLVDNGETVVLGGVYERTKIFAKEQVPWIGDVPVLGRLFKREAREDNNSELLIFVTPKILKGDLVGN